MNKNLFRVIFSKKRGVMMAVQETAASHGKGSQSGSVSSASESQPLMRFALLTVAVAALFGNVTVVGAQIVSDPNAGQRRPTVDTTANGRPLVQITTPNAAGVSHNQYSQFNVAPTGAILNNAVTITQTQQGGFVAGNPNLATGARIILNEVTGTGASSLRGYTEVAGQRAEVIIANPNGISCDGCGFINTSRGMLTTGAPMFGGDGSLNAFRVTGGEIAIGAGGLNGSNTDQLDLIARSVKVNGELWGANLNVITGVNQVNYTNLGVQVLTGDANKPTVGIDVSNLGGMYANKIRLVGTEAGVGVVSAGNLAAQAGDLTIDNQGKITLTGTTNASGAISLSSNNDIANSGTVYGQQNVQVTSTRAVINTGFVGARGNLGVNAASVDSSGILGAGVSTSGAVSQNGNMTITASGSVKATGQNVAGANINLTGTSVDLTNGSTNAGGTIALTATAGSVDNSGGQIQAASGLTVDATSSVKNDNAQISAGQVTINAASLSNQSGSISQSGTGNTAITTSGAINNTGGTLSTNALTMTLQSGALTNTLGTIQHAGTGVATISTGVLTNTGGTIASNGQTTIAAASIVNQGGVISAQGQAGISSQAGIDNSVFNGTGGYIGADSLTITASNGQLNNAGGTIEANDGVTIASQSLANAAGSIQNLGNTDTNITTTGALNNTASGGTGGFIGGNGKVNVTAGSLDNTGSTLQANGSLTLQAGGALTNHNGAIQTEDKLIVTASGAIDNTGGRMEANGAASTTLITSVSIDNTAGRIANAGTGLTQLNITGHVTNANAATLTGMGVIGGNGEVRINSANLSNTQNGQILAGGNLTLGTTTSLDNSGGKLYAGGNLTANQAGTQVNNTSGNIGALGNISITGASIDNSSGQIANTAGSGSNITMNVSGNVILSSGKIAADQDLALTANTLAGSGQAAAGRDTAIALQGDFTNAAGNQLSANRDLALSVTGTLTNAGNLTAVNGLTVTGANISNQNTGLMNAQTTVVKAAGSLTNTGRIYGNDVSIGASQFTNDTANGLAGVVAARNTLNIGAVTVTNRENALLYSEGDMTIARTLGVDNKATGTADLVTNSSARIETGSNGSLTINAASTVNTNAHFATEQVQTGQTALVDYQGDGSANRWDSSLMTPARCVDGIDCITLPDGTFLSYTIRSYTRTTTDTFVTQSAPGEILVGRNMSISGAITNDKSRIVVGGSLTGTTTSITNIDANGQSVSTDVGTAQHTYTRWRGGFRSERRRYWDAPVDMVDAPIVTTTSLGIVASQINTAPINNANPAAGQTVGSTALTAATSVALDANQATAALQSSGQSQTVIGGGATSPVFNLPNNALFTIQSQPGQNYLIETDPQFANYRNFLSSDYMISRLGLDPQGVQKRLGDGFYEQKLINDQITQMTGRRYLSGYASAETEFKALMDSGIASAATFNLVPGIALSEAQMASLTHDIVWLVEKTVTLPNGQSQRVLAPVVYLTRAHAQDLQPSGAIIAAESIDLKIHGSLQNSGTIRADSRLVIDATDIQNRGRVGSNRSTGTTNLIATNDVVNQGGTLSGHRVGIVAGRDFVMQSLAMNTKGATGTRTTVDQVASVNAGSLFAQAGRDVTLTASKITTTGDTTVVAGRDVVLNAITTGASEDLTFNARNNLRQSNTNVAGSQIQSGGNVVIQAAQDLKATASDVTATGDLTVVAGRDITLDTSQKSNSYSQEVFREKKGFLSKKSSHTINTVETSRAVGSNFTGNAVTLNANRNLGIAGSAVVGTGDVTLTASAGDVTIAAAQGSHREKHFSEQKASGLFTSNVGLGVTIGSRQSKSDFEGSGTTQSESRSAVGSTGGNLIITAGGNAAIKGSDLIADRAQGDILKATGHIDIQAQNITVDPGQDNARTKSTLDTKSSGVTVALVGTPYDTYRNLREVQKRESNFKKMQGTIDEIANSSVTSPQITINFDRSQTHQRLSGEEQTHSGSSLIAAGDILLRATGNGTTDATGRAVDGNVNVTGSIIKAGELVKIDAERDINLQASTDRYRETFKATKDSLHLSTGVSSLGDTGRQITGGPNHGGVGAFPYGKANSSDSADTTAAIQTPTLITGENVVLNSRTGNIRVSGTGINAIKNIDVTALRGKIDVTTGQESRTHTEDHTNKLVGDLGKVGSTGTANTVGFYDDKSTLDSTQNQQNTIRSHMVAGGNVTLDAKEDITIQGTDLRAGKDLTVIGRNLNLDPGMDDSRTKQTTEMNQGGMTISLSGYAIEAVKALEMAANAYEQKDNKKLAALYGAKAALTVYNGVTGGAGNNKGAGDAAAPGEPGINAGTGSGTDNQQAPGVPIAATPPSNGGDAAIKVTVSVGSKSADSQSEVNSTQNLGSTLTAGQTVTLVATGNGQTDAQGKAIDGDINARGTKISGTDVVIAAARDINLHSVQDTTNNRSSDNSSSASVGVGFGLGGSQNGFTIELAAAKSEGKANGDSATNRNTEVTANNNVSMVSGRDTNLRGAQVKGDTVIATVGRDLNISSLQDKDNFKSKQDSSGFSVSLCIPPICYGATVSGSVSVSSGDTDSTYASVVHQSGLYAGNGGFDVAVQGNTDLKGSVIASTADASKNILSTGTLTTSDIRNHAAFKSSNSSITLSYSGGNSPQSTAQNPTSVSNITATGSTLQTVTNNLAANAAANALPGQGGNATGVTKSAIADGTIIITDEPGQLQRTGKTAAETIASLNRDTASANGSIGKIFDKTKLEQEQEEKRVMSEVAQQAAPIIYKKIGNQLVDQPTEVKVAVHALVGGVMSKLIGGEFASGAAASAAATLVVETFGKDIEKIEGMSQEDKKALTMLVGGLAGKLVATAAGAGSAESNAAGTTTKLATEHNYLKHTELELLRDKLAECKKKNCTDAEINELLKKFVPDSRKNNADIWDCQTRACIEEHQRAIAQAKMLAIAVLSGENTEAHLFGVLQGLEKTDHDIGIKMQQIRRVELVKRSENDWKIANCHGLTEQQCAGKLEKAEKRDAQTASLLLEVTPVGDIKSLAEAETKTDYTLAVVGTIGPLGKFIKWVFKGGKAVDKVADASKVSDGAKGGAQLVEGASSLIGANRAIIDPRKLTEYALNPAHPVGGNKARVFESALGFTKNNSDDLMSQLRQGVMNNPPIAGKVDQFGSRFTVDIPVTGPAGSGVVRSGWIYKPGSNVPEMTTIFVK